MEGYKRRHEGTGETYSKRKGKRTVCPHPRCGQALAIGSLQSYLRTQHGMDASGSTIIHPTALVYPIRTNLALSASQDTHDIEYPAQWVAIIQQQPWQISSDISSIAIILTVYT